MNQNTTVTSDIHIQETTQTDIISNLAHQIWPVTYQEILAADQISYMLEQLYTPASLQQQMQEGQTFLLLTQQEVPVAFAAYSLYNPNERIFKLNKIYLHPDYQGKGLGNLLLHEVVSRAKALGGQALVLNVHRSNPAQHFYQKHGFQIHQVLDIPFGPYTLNDYIMWRPL